MCYAVLTGDIHPRVGLASLYRRCGFGVAPVCALHWASMPRDSTRSCAYMSCKKTTDKRGFGQPRTLSHAQLSSYSSWLKPQHDGVLCNCHYTMLRRLLATQSLAQDESAARMEALLSAPGIVDSLASSPSSPSALSAIIVSFPPLTTPIQAQRSSSLPEVPTTSSAPSTPPALHRSPSAPLLRANQRGCDRRQ